MKKQIILIGITLAVLLACLLRWRPLNTRLPDRCDGALESNELLDAALQYLDARPQYKSAYYAGSGYPTDQYGTCVDVIGIALRSCEYDLRTRLNADVLAHPERYAIDEPDIDIDFRRVKNLKVYFAANEEELTTDVSNRDAWQPGDLVLFANHIGMVSNHRNADGIPYIIHHRSFFQLRYEEDYLSSHQPEMHIRIRQMKESYETETSHCSAGADTGTAVPDRTDHSRKRVSDRIL